MDNVKKCSAHSFLCGYFGCDDLPALISSEKGAGAGWQRQIITKEKYARHCDIYYESYVDSLLEKESRSEERRNIYHGTSHYVLELNAKCVLKSEEIYKEFTACGKKTRNYPLTEDYRFTINKIHLFGFPYGIVLFAVEIDEADVSMEGLSSAHQELRSVSAYQRWAERKVAGDYLDAIEPLVRLCSTPGAPAPEYGRLVETGGKLKIFQIIQTTSVEDDLLYELGCLFKPGIIKEGTSKACPSESYYNGVMNSNTLQVFNNWKVLALFDTFTVMGDVNFFHWSSYFRMIYVHSLYQKRLLFDLNQRFRKPSQAKVMGRLVNEMMERERYYAFPTISYNFLPQMIYEKINYGLGVGNEREQLHKYIEQEGQRMETLVEKRTSRLLFALTFLAVASAIFDLTSLVTSILGYEPATCCYNLVSGIVVAVILVVMTSVLIYNKIRKV